VPTPASILIVREGVNVLASKEQLWKELTSLEWDTKAFMYGRVVDKHARHNLVFAPVAQEPDYEHGRGRIIAWDAIPQLNQLRLQIQQTLHASLPKDMHRELLGEGNLYHDVSKTGIGWHGDGERKVVIGVRLGATLPLHFHWFHRNRPRGNECKLELRNGDIYIMSEKASGNDWKRSSLWTLRHAAGCTKFLKLPQRRNGRKNTKS